MEDGGICVLIHMNNNYNSYELVDVYRGFKKTVKKTISKTGYNINNLWINQYVGSCEISKYIL